MSPGCSTFGCLLMLIWFAESGLLVTRVQAQGKPQPRRSIELSETNSAEILTNLNQLSTKKDGFRQLEDQLKSLRFSSGNALDANVALPYASPGPPVLQNKRLKELLERHRDWTVSTEDFGMTASSSQGSSSLSGSGEDVQDSKKTSLQQFYDALNRTGQGAQNADKSADGRSLSSGKSPSSRDQILGDEDSSLPSGIRDKAQRLKQLSNGESGSLFNVGSSRSSFENFFGLESNPQLGTEATRKSSMDSFLDEFKKGLDSQTASSGGNSLLNLMAPATSTKRSGLSTAVEPLATPAAQDPKNAAPSLLTSGLRPSTLLDVNANVLNQWNPYYTPPKLEIPKITPPAPPTFDFPRRKF